MGKLMKLGTVVVALVAALALVASTASGAHRQTSASPPAGPKQLSAAAWNAMVAKAKQEGRVTIYTIGAPTGYQAVAAKFKELYGISVTVNRQVDNTLLAQINAEETTGKAVADVWVAAAKPLVLGALQHKWVTDAVGPNFFAKRYDRSKLLIGKAWITGSSLLGVAWNTQAVPGGVKDLTDFLKPEFKGKLSIPDPRISPANVDWYNWVKATYGAGFLGKLAAQNPKVYGSSLTATQAVASGEIIGATQSAGSAAVSLKAAGAPVGYGLPNHGNAWNAGNIGMILRQAPHPAAAQVLANFLISPEGQALAQAGLGALYPNVPGTFYSPPRVARANDLSPAKVSAFITEWSKLFLH
ncbi:MAG TPA: extracellular solute-binding protein [Gaiellaceae bacterium]